MGVIKVYIWLLTSVPWLSRVGPVLKRDAVSQQDWVMVRCRDGVCIGSKSKWIRFTMAFCRPE